MAETISLGGRSFAIRPLKLGELRHVLDALDAMAGKTGGGLIEAAAQVVAAGLKPAYPEIGHDALLDLEATAAELNTAVAAVLRVAGLAPAENATGEPQPVASRAGTSAAG